MATPPAMPGQIGLTDANSQFNAHHFVMRMLQARIRTAVLVQVKKVHTGTYAHSYSVDVQPLVNQVDGAGNVQAHQTVFGIPMLSLSGANGAIIVKPAVNDLGLMVCCDRDGSSAIAANGSANPASARMHDFSDGVYLGGFLNFNNASHWLIADENGFTINGNLTITGGVSATAAITTTGEVVAKSGVSGGVHLSTHTHGGVATGAGTSGSPTPGS